MIEMLRQRCSYNAPASSSVLNEMETLRQNHGYWVTVFGFPKGFARKALQQMRQFGTITDHTMPTKNCNWFYVRYSCLREARKAAKNQDAELLTSTIMIGVKLRGKRGIGHLPHGQLKPTASQLLPTTQQLSNVLENEANGMTDSRSDFQVKQEVESDKEQDHPVPFNFCPDSPNSTKPLFTTEQSQDLPILKRVAILCDVSAKEKQDDGCSQSKGLLTSSPQLTAHEVPSAEATDDRLEKTYSENFGSTSNTIRHVTVKEEVESDHDYTYAIVCQPVNTFDGNTQNFASDIIRSLQLEENVEAVIDSEGRHGNMEEKEAGSEDLTMTVEEEGDICQGRGNVPFKVVQKEGADSPDRDICSDDLHDQKKEDKEEGEGGISKRKMRKFSSKDKKAEKQPSKLCANNLFKKEISETKQTSAETSHGQQKKKDGKRQCDVCGYSTKYSSHLAKHMLTHMQAKRFSCDGCSYSTNKKSDLTRHVTLGRCFRKRKDKPDRKMCDVCGYLAKYRDFATHMRTHLQGKKKYACNVCGYATNKKGDLTRHVTLDRCFRKRKDKPDRKKCDVCGYLAKYRDFATHMRTHLQGKKKYACDVCGYATNKKGDLTRHVTLDRCFRKRKDKPDRKKCDVCGYVADRRRFTQHMLTHAEEKRFACDICDYATNKKGTLTRHMYTHTQDKQFVCEVCGKRFLVKRYLDRHLISHSGEKKVMCSYCGQRFAFTESLTTHMRMHTGEMPFTCNICDKKFPYPSSLHHHRRRKHINSRPVFQCSFCEYSSERYKTIKEHEMHEHTKKYPCKCDVCGWGCIMPDELEKHMTSKHMK